MALPGWFAVAGILLWVGYEVLLRRRSDSDAASWTGDAADRGSTRLLIAAYLGSVVLLTVLSALDVGWVPVKWRWIGVALIAAGLALRAWGMAVLGRFYTRTLRVVSGQSIVRSGPYRVIRHPGYAGSILVWTGYCLGVGNWIALIAVATLMLIAYGWRITSEERLLVAEFGPEYTAYQSHTSRLIPFLY